MFVCFFDYLNNSLVIFSFFGQCIGSFDIAIYLFEKNGICILKLKNKLEIIIYSIHTSFFRIGNCS